MSFNDATCPDCGKRFGWQGELKDKPACPKCGWEDDPEEIARVEALLEKLTKEMLE